MPSVQFPYLSLETKPLKLTIDKKNCFISLGSYFQVMPKHVVKCGFTSHSAVQLKGGDSIGLGMVRDGTRCGRNKVGYHCPLFNTLPGFVLSCRLLINIQTQSQTLRTFLFHKYKAVWQKSRPLSYSVFAPLHLTLGNIFLYNKFIVRRVWKNVNH